MAYYFAGLVNMLISTTFAAGALLLFRLLVEKRLPAAFCYLLRGVALFRLCVPFSFPLFPLPLAGCRALWMIWAAAGYSLRGGPPFPPETQRNIAD